MGGPPDDSKLEIKVQTRQHHQHQQRGHRSESSPLPPPSRSRHSHNKWFPWFVPTIVVVNCVLFVVSLYINDCPAHSDRCFGESFLGRFAFQSTHENPLLGPSALTLRGMGALDVKKIVEKHEVWRLVTCMWLHAGVFHILANMLSLVFVGIQLEQEFGFVRVGLLYVISGIGGSLLSSLFVRTTISVGASGALFGLLGAMLSELLTNWTIYTNKCTTLTILIAIIIVNLAVGILPHVDNFAHLGGFITGFLLGFILFIRPQYKYTNRKHSGYHRASHTPKYKVYQFVLFALALVLLASGFAVGLSLLLNGVDGNKRCSWCHYLSCVPTPLWNCTPSVMHCTSLQDGNTMNLTCVGNHRSQILYLTPDTNSTDQIQQMCAKLCS